jgi:hypothetical protein
MHPMLADEQLQRRRQDYRVRNEQLERAKSDERRLENVLCPDSINSSIAFATCTT